MGFFKLFRLFSSKKNVPDTRPDPVKAKEKFTKDTYDYYLYRRHKAEIARPRRPLEKDYDTPVGKLKDTDGGVKCLGAKKIFENANGHPRQYTDREIKALTEGKLGGIIEAGRAAGVLPQDYLRDEKHYKEFKRSVAAKKPMRR